MYSKIWGDLAESLFRRVGGNKIERRHHEEIEGGQRRPFGGKSYPDVGPTVGEVGSCRPNVGPLAISPARRHLTSIHTLGRRLLPLNWLYSILTTPTYGNQPSITTIWLKWGVSSGRRCPFIIEMFLDRIPENLPTVNEIFPDFPYQHQVTVKIIHWMKYRVAIFLLLSYVLG